MNASAATTQAGWAYPGAIMAQIEVKPDGTVRKLTPGWTREELEASIRLSTLIETNGGLKAKPKMSGFDNRIQATDFNFGGFPNEEVYKQYHGIASGSGGTPPGE